MRRTYTHPDGETEVIDSIHEVYYDEDGTIVTWTTDGVAPTFHVGVDEGTGIADDINRFLRATDKPILDWETGKEID